MTLEEGIKHILAMGHGGDEKKKATATPALSERAAAFLARNYGPTAMAMGQAFNPSRLARPDNPFSAAGDFAAAYQDMRDANHIGADKYFHCRGNCEAAQRGPVSEWTAERLSNAREAAQMRVGRPPEALQSAIEDQQANRWGRRSGRGNPDKTCTGLCSRYRPDSLPPRYR